MGHDDSAKAALNIFCEGLFYLNMDKKLSIRVIKAGFVGTSKTLKIAPRFLCISPQKFARKLLENIDKKSTMDPRFMGLLENADQRAVDAIERALKIKPSSYS